MTPLRFKLYALTLVIVTIAQIVWWTHNWTGLSTILGFRHVIALVVMNFTIIGWIDITKWFVIVWEDDE